MKQLFLICTFFIFSLSGNGLADSPQEVKIGFIAGLSGQYAHISHLMLAGAQEAVHHCNEKLAPQNTRLVILPEDDGLTDSKTTLTVVKKFTSVDKVSAILAWAFSTNRPLKSALGGKKTPVIFFWDYNPAIAELGDNFYGTGPNISENAHILVNDFIHSGSSRLGIISVVDEWSTSMRNEIAHALQDKGQHFSIEEQVLFDHSDFKSVITRAKKSSTQGLVLLSWGAGLITLVNQLHELWPEVQLYIIGQPESDMKLMGTSANGINVINGWIEGALASKLLGAITKDPLISSKNISPVDLAYTAYGFQSGDILCNAITKVLSSKQTITDESLNLALRSIDYNVGLGAIGPGRYNKVREHVFTWNNRMFTRKSN